MVNNGFLPPLPLNLAWSKIVLPPPNKASYAICRRAFLLQAINLVGAPSMVTNNANDGNENNEADNMSRLATITRILEQSEVSDVDRKHLMQAFCQSGLRVQDLIQPINGCLQREANDSKN